MQSKPKKTPPKASTYTLEERFRFGNFSLAEILPLKGVKMTTLYTDIRRERLYTEKHGRRTTVPGPIALLYIDNKPMPSNPAAYVAAVRSGGTGDQATASGTPCNPANTPVAAARQRISPSILESSRGASQPDRKSRASRTPSHFDNSVDQR